MNHFYNNIRHRFDGSQVTFPKLLQTRRLPDGDCRQVAPGQQPHRLRLLEHPARPGPLLQPADDSQRQRRSGTRGLRHRDHHRAGAGLAEKRPRQEQAVSVDVPPQGPAPELGAGAGEPVAVRRGEIPGAAHAVRRLQRPRQGRARPEDDDRQRHECPQDLKLVAPAELNAEQRKAWDAYYEPAQRGLSQAEPPGERAGPLEVPAVPARLLRLHRLHRPVRGQATGLSEAGRAGPEHHRGLLLRPGLLPGRARLVRQAVDLRRIAARPASGPLARRGQAGERQ